MDLAELFAQGRWHHLVTLIQQLPNASRYKAALYQDPDNADELWSIRLESEKRGDKWSPPLEEYSLLHAMVAQLINETRAVQSAVIAAAGGKPSKVQPFPEPQTVLSDKTLEAKYRSAANKAALDRLFS